MSLPLQLSLVKGADGRYALQPALGEVANGDEIASRAAVRSLSRPVLQSASRYIENQVDVSAPWGTESHKQERSAAQQVRLPTSSRKGGPGSLLGLGDTSPTNTVSSPSRQANGSVLSKLRHSQNSVLAAFDSNRIQPASQQGNRNGTGDDQIRNRLLQVGSSFVNLDRQVEEDAKRRRELEQRRLDEIMNALSKLEQRLMDEAASREHDSQKTTEAAEHFLKEAVAEVQSKIATRFSHLTRSIESLCDRCASVERGIQQFRGEVPTKLKVETHALRHLLSEMAFAFQADIKQRADKDLSLQRAVEEAGFDLDSAMQQELTHLERRGESLQEIIDVFAASKDSQELKRLQAFVVDGIADIRTSLEAEARIREAADDQVVQAINEYTSTLHRSLSTANNA